tara:strand:- start:406 stop:519 length:114 start_codon:yes stop_codon:yes gene_type:complete
MPVSDPEENAEKIKSRNSANKSRYIEFMVKEVLQVVN